MRQNDIAMGLLLNLFALRLDITQRDRASQRCNIPKSVLVSETSISLDTTPASALAASQIV